MACEGFETRLIERAVTDTDPALTAHLATCADCRAELAAKRALQERITNGIAAMVADEPSPALLTRVRAQIASDRARRSGNWIQWAIASVTVTAVAAVAMWMIGRPSGRLSGAGDLPARVASSALSSTRANPPTQVAVRESSGLKQLITHERHAVSPIVKVAQPVVTATANNSSSEIIVPAGQREAVLRLVNALRTGRVDAASLIRTSQPGEIAPLVTIAPLEIKPINGGGGDGSGYEFDIEF